MGMNNRSKYLVTYAIVNSTNAYLDLPPAKFTLPPVRLPKRPSTVLPTPPRSPPKRPFNTNI